VRKKKENEEKKKKPSTLYLAAYEGAYRNSKLEREYPELFNDGYFCYTHDYATAHKDGELEDRTKCPKCNKMHWKEGWSK
jgi:hypothetical protein